MLELSNNNLLWHFQTKCILHPSSFSSIGTSQLIHFRSLLTSFKTKSNLFLQKLTRFAFSIIKKRRNFIFILLLLIFQMHPNMIRTVMFFTITFTNTNCARSKHQIVFRFLIVIFIFGTRIKFWFVSFRMWYNLTCCF